jgi:hypothetical protein
MSLWRIRLERPRYAWTRTSNSTPSIEENNCDSSAAQLNSDVHAYVPDAPVGCGVTMPSAPVSKNDHPYTHGVA